MKTKQKVLIVDDNSTNLMILGELLQEEYEVFVANSGENALRQVESNRPDLILLDILMPGMDGYEVCRRLKEEHGTKKIPIIFITAKDTEEDEVKGLDLGAVDYITKPFRLPIVKARVRTHLELKRKTDLLESISSLDGLTGIPNRRQFDSVISAEWKRAARNSKPLSVGLLDIDFFKLYNDNYGHLSGDQCLKKVARAINEGLQRPADFAARYGGEEFAMVLPETPADKALLVAERIRKIVQDLKVEHNYSPVSPYITISAGMASTVPGPNTGHLVLLEVADHALYDAKQSGRNRVRQREIKL